MLACPPTSKEGRDHGSVPKWQQELDLHLNRHEVELGYGCIDLRDTVVDFDMEECSHISGSCFEKLIGGRPSRGRVGPG